ncbi:MAG: succinyl-diaminopimelate desuccinylase [Pseudomonadota bacterium]
MSAEATALTTALIARPSVTPDDAGCQQLLAAELAPLGFRNESQPFNDTLNLWSRRGAEAPVFCFAGHTDVVPPGDTASWDTDPFQPTERDGLLYGRGAADMKASLAAMVVATRAFLAECPEPRGSIAFLITSDEEGPARDGTRRVVETLTARDERIDWCLIGEPSSQHELGDLIRIGRRGSLSGMLRVHGVQGHVAYPQLADNPIARFAPVLQALCDERWDDGNAYFPPTSFQVVQLEAGSGAPNVTPAELYVRFNFRYCTEWHYSDLQKRVTELLQGFELNYTLDWHLSGEPFLTTEPDLRDAVVAAVEAVLEVTPELSTGGGTSDGRFIAPAGVQVIELGPVNASIHKVNEHVRIGDIGRLTEVYLQVLRNLLSR